LQHGVMGPWDGLHPLKVIEIFPCDSRPRIVVCRKPSLGEVRCWHTTALPASIGHEAPH
jgi:hypothetical protein